MARICETALARLAIRFTLSCDFSALRFGSYCSSNRFHSSFLTTLATQVLQCLSTAQWHRKFLAAVESSC